jgi:hypothetical protein
MRTASKERAKQLRAYSKRLKSWKREHPHCAACERLAIWRPGRHVIRLTADCHHIRGRNGELLLDERWWLPVCSWCHRFITEHGRLARQLGLSGDVDYRVGAES